MREVEWTVDDELSATLGVCDEVELSLHERFVLWEVFCRDWEAED